MKHMLIGLTAGISRFYKNSTNLPQDVTSIIANSGQTFVSNGTNWFLISGV